MGSSKHRKGNVHKDRQPLVYYVFERTTIAYILKRNGRGDLASESKGNLIFQINGMDIIYRLEKF